jgi:hypothetical protein
MGGRSLLPPFSPGFHDIDDVEVADACRIHYQCITVFKLIPVEVLPINFIALKGYSIREFDVQVTDGSLSHSAITLLLTSELSVFELSVISAAFR